MKISLIALLVLFLTGCSTPRVRMDQHAISDDSNCSYSYHNTNSLRPKTIIIVHLACPDKKWMDYFFDADSSVWKANSWGKRRKFEYRLVYDKSFELKITDTEKQIFNNVMK